MLNIAFVFISVFLTNMNTNKYFVVVVVVVGGGLQNFGLCLNLVYDITLYVNLGT